MCQYEGANMPICMWKVLTVIHPEDGGGDVLRLRVC